MKTPVVIASLTVVGSIAYATGSQGVAGKQPPMMPSGSQAHSMKEEMNGGPAGDRHPGRSYQGVPCSGNPLQWLTEIHDAPNITPYCNFAALPPEAADVNRDEVVEAFYVADSIRLIRNGETIPDAECLWYSELSHQKSVVSSQMRPILRSDLIRSWADANGLLNGYTIVEAFVVGWQDMDGDKDLDLAIGIIGGTQSTWYERLIWIENTGFQHTNRVAADLNGDGMVDGNDLGNLLAAWGPTQ